jgi:polyisoprenoid-binding protein YceI
MNAQPLALILLALPALAGAEEFAAAQPERGNLAFVYKQMGVAMEGRFARYSAQMKFDPERPAAASASIEVDLASIDAGSPEATDEVLGKQWFNAKTFPTGRFVATAIRPLGGNRYEAVGKMSLKGRSLDIVAPFTFTRQGGGTAIAEGGFVLKRADYAIGEGAWADFGTVANEVQIKFRLQATARK